MCYLSLVLPLLVYFTSLFLPHELAPFVLCPPPMAIVCWVSLHPLRLSHREPISCCAWSQTVFAFPSLFIADFLESQNSQYLKFKKKFLVKTKFCVQQLSQVFNLSFFFCSFMCMCVCGGCHFLTKQRKAQTNA